MKHSQVLVYSLDQVDAIAAQLVDLLENSAIVTLKGPLGVGKTTLVRALLRAWHVTDSITSPTYTYVNVYNNKAHKTFYHFDLYRVHSIDDFVQAGFNEYLYVPNSLALIEWPDSIESLLQDKVTHLTIDYHDGLDKRVLHITHTS